MIGLLQGLFSGTVKLPVTSSEKCGEDRVEAAYTEPAEEGTSFFAMLVQLFTPQSSKQAEVVGIVTVETTDEMFSYATMPEGNEQRGEVSSNVRSLDTLVAKMTPVVSTSESVEPTSGIVDAPQASNTQVGYRRAQSSAQSHLVDNGEQREQRAPVVHGVGQMHRATDLQKPAAMQNNTGPQPDPTVRSDHDVSQESPTQNVVMGGPNSRPATEIIERRSEGFPLNWNKTGSSEIVRDSVRETGRQEVAEGLRTLSPEVGRPSVREAGSQGVAEELQILTNKFSTVGILKRETPESTARMNIPAEYSEDISTDETERVQTRDGENTNHENKAGLQQSPSRSNLQAVKQAGVDQAQIDQPSVMIPEPVSPNKANPVNLPGQPTVGVAETKFAKEDSETNTENDTQLDPGLQEKGKTPPEAKSVQASNQDMRPEVVGRPVSAEFQQIPIHSRPDTPNSFQAAEKPYVPVQLPRDFAQNLMVRISDELKAHIEGKSSKVRVVMKPESMGQLSLRVAMEDGRLVAIMDVSKTAVKIALEAQLPQLREALAAQGINVERFDILSGSTTQFERHGEGSAFHRQQHSRRQMDVDVAERYDTVKYLGYNTVEYII